MRAKQTGDAPGRGWVVGITGGIACGKSEVGRILAKRGVAVLDTDRVAHEVMAPGQDVYRRVVARFGREILDPSGAIDRARLGQRVFENEEERGVLNSLVHPEVLRIARAWVRARRREGARAAVIIPLLFEVGETEPWDAILCVASDEERMRARLRKKGLSEAEANQRLLAQWPLAEKVRRSDYVIWNNGTLKQLEKETLRVFNTLNRKER